MTSTAFDTLEYARELTDAGVPSEQVEASARALAKALGHAIVNQLATKADLAELRAELKSDIADLRAELKADIMALKWMMAIIVLVNGVPILRSFFN